MTETVFMNEQEVKEAVQALADLIAKRNDQLKNTALLGIRTRGVVVAERLAEALKKTAGAKPKLGALDTRPFRDDIAYEGKDESTIPFDINGTDVIIVDDVISTGRTMRAAMDAVIGHGRPATIKIAVLIDRGHREYPIVADYVGRVIPTSSRETVRLKVREVDGGRDRVLIIS